MYKLVLNAGDYVRNINEASRRYRCRGVVDRISENMYHVEYEDGIKASYHKKTAHKYLEKIVEINNQCKCIHDEVCDKCARQMLKNFLAPLYYGAGPQTLAEYMAEKKTTLKKERRNVITGKTQSEMIKQCGTALGVTQFNTRALGKSTGQAMVKIGEAMMHPNVPVRILDVDHAITEHGTPRRVANNHFADTIEGIIRKQGLKGLHILNGEELLYLPIVTEETYVNI
ncbi:hypothetical protein HOR60_gp21 [Escherichia phage vB_EcoP_K]|uniref:Uncharacterized protein n=2 Tax=Vectrevirus TaxID=2732928 RepID=A0A1Q1PU54_9CAUD|nr:hypothetical protein HOR57_gp23 [Escherichia phage vB_EcoP_B]YP_009789140.1 hypothetical protein HOR60_gp21 [Escherichia phage vB_EcoP_K]AQN31607.1 hypothetical protein B_23 [Escherichia phage vB_EcoP_B]AQN31913.1 hypothetical protein K_21 [Escherichia phage vB_EcoP_K]